MFIVVLRNIGTIKYLLHAFLKAGCFSILIFFNFISMKHRFYIFMYSVQLGGLFIGNFKFVFDSYLNINIKFTPLKTILCDSYFNVVNMPVNSTV
jgi:hypothetical protein